MVCIPKRQISSQISFPTFSYISQPPSGKLKICFSSQLSVNFRELCNKFEFEKTSIEDDQLIHLLLLIKLNRRADDAGRLKSL